MAMHHEKLGTLVDSLATVSRLPQLCVQQQQQQQQQVVLEVHNYMWYHAAKYTSNRFLLGQHATHCSRLSVTMSKGKTGLHTWCTAGRLSDLSAKVIGLSSSGCRLPSWPQVANASHSFCQAAKVATGSLVLLVWVNNFSTSCTA